MTAMEEGQLTFAPQQPIEVVKEKSRLVKEKREAVSRITKLEEELAIKSETQDKLLEQDKEKSRTITQQNEMIHTKDE